MNYCRLYYNRTSNARVEKPLVRVDFRHEIAFNTVTITEQKSNSSNYQLEYIQNGVWIPILITKNTNRVKVNRFAPVYCNKVRVWLDKPDHQISIA